MSAGLSLHFAYRHVRAGLGRRVMSIVALALGVGLVVAVQVMNTAVLDAFLDTIDGMAGRAALTVTAGEGLSFDEGIVEKVAAVPGVTLAVPLVRGVAFPDDGSGELLTLHGVDVANDAAVRVYHRGDTSALVEDVLEFLNAKDSIIVGREFADRRSLRVGDSLVLVTPTGIKPFRIRGLLDPEGLARTLNGRLVVMDVYAAELSFTGRGHINQVDLLVERDRQASVKAAVEEVLPQGLKVEEPAIHKQVIRRTVAGFQAMLTAFASLAVLAGLVICYSQLASIFESRTWEIGLMRAVGLSRLVVFRELLKESLLLGIVGTVGGIVLGRAIGERALPVVARTAALNFRLPIPESVAALTLEGLAVGLGVGILASLIAATIPAFRLARKQPVAALTMRGREAPDAGPRIAGIASIGLVIVAGTLVVVQHVTGWSAVGNVTAGVLALMACMAARPLVMIGGGLLTPLWTSVFGAAGGFAVRHVAQQVRRVALATATLGIGLGAILMFGMLAWSFEETLVRVLTTRMRADLVVNSAFTGSGYVGAPLDDTILDELRTIPGVALAAGERQRDVGYHGGEIVIDAYDPSCFEDARVCQWILDPGALPDAHRSVAVGEAALVSSAFARAHRTNPGDTLELHTPHGPLTITVAGVTNGQPASAVILSRVAYEALWNDSLLSWIHVAVADPAEVATVKRRIEERVGEQYRVQVRSSTTLIEYFATQVRQAFQFVYVMEAVIFLIVLVAMGDTLSSSVIERTRVFGMMRAVGLSRSDLFRVVLLEGAAIGVLGLGLALVLGVTLGTFWVKIQFPALLGWTLDVHLPYGFVSGAAALSLGLCVLASIIPSIRAGRLPVTNALRAE